MSDGTESVSEAIASMNDLLDRLGKKGVDFGANADGWEFTIVNKFDKPVVAGRFTPADNIIDISRTEVHFDQAVVKESVSSEDSVHLLRADGDTAGWHRQDQGREAPVAEGLARGVRVLVQGTRGRHVRVVLQRRGRPVHVDPRSAW